MSSNTLLHRLVRPAATALARTSVTPNHVTFCRFLTGLAAAGLFSWGTDSARHAAAGVFVLSSILDRLDGELARASGRISAKGHRIDIMADAASNILCFTGFGMGLRNGTLGIGAPVLGALTGFCVFLLYRLLSEFDLQAAMRGRDQSRWADPDDALFLVPILIWLGWSQALLQAMAVITAAAVLLVRGLAFRPRLRRTLNQEQGGSCA